MYKENTAETSALKVRLPGKAKEYCFRLKAEAEEAQRQWLEAEKLGESGAEIREK